jgi:hypothetical protein
VRTLSLDQGFLFLNTGGTAQSYATGTFISFSGLINTPPGSGLTWSASNPTILNIANTGYYQVTFGIAVASGSAGAPLFCLQFGEAQASEFPFCLEPRPGGGLISFTVILHVISANTHLRLQNNSVSGIELVNDVYANGSAPAAYISIIRLQ